jgi:hypothetical protein
MTSQEELAGQEGLTEAIELVKGFLRAMEARVLAKPGVLEEPAGA